MNIQKVILEQYMELFSEPTLKEIAADTGIQLTRVFRLLNGSAMKLSEYQIFQERVKVKMGLSASLEALAFECSMKLSPTAIKELEGVLKRKLETWKLTQCQQKPQTHDQKIA